MKDTRENPSEESLMKVGTPNIVALVKQQVSSPQETFDLASSRKQMR